MPGDSSSIGDKANPQIREIEIGVKDLRKVKIIPLSIGDHLKTTSLIVKTLGAFASISDDDGFVEAKVAKALSEIIKENIDRILAMIIDVEGLNFFERLFPKIFSRRLLNQITNSQMIKIATIVYEEMTFHSTLFESLENTRPCLKRAARN